MFYLLPSLLSYVVAFLHVSCHQFAWYLIIFTMPHLIIHHLHKRLTFSTDRAATSSQIFLNPAFGFDP